MGNFLKAFGMSPNSVEESPTDKVYYNMACGYCHKKITKKSPYMFTIHGIGKHNNRILCANCLQKSNILNIEYM